MLGNSHAALCDVSQCIHVDTTNAHAFAFRGKLLSTNFPQRALVDLSVSIMLDNTVRNLQSFVHRGILYAMNRKMNAASSDFETAAMLEANEYDRTVGNGDASDSGGTRHVAAFVQCQLGLILMTHHHNLIAALFQFKRAIALDPSSVFPYIYRADCYRRVHRHAVTHDAQGYGYPSHTWVVCG